MNMDQSAVVERDELMLAAAVDGTDYCAAKRLKTSHRIAAPQAAMKHAHASNGFAHDGMTEPPYGVFDFGKFRHGCERPDR
jgi:hypothetical protein